eukprot:5134524-Prymnesium_polylepis.1
MLRCADAATSNHSQPLRSVEPASRRIAPNAALRHVASSRPCPAISCRRLLFTPHFTPSKLRK